MRSPCSDCPFLRECGVFLRRDRVETLIYELQNDAMFPCHKTVDYSAYEREGLSEDQANALALANESPCIGAAIFMEKVLDGMLANFQFRLWAMAGKLHPAELDLSANTFGSIDEFLENCV